MLSYISSNSVSTPNQFEIDTLSTEKRNIINIFKLVVKDLIDISLKNNKHVDKQSEHLIYFYDVFENVLNHGFKGKKGFGLSMLRNKDLTVLLDVISTKSDSSGCLSSIKDFAEIKTSIGRIRAWMRLCLMQKKLAENFQNLIQEKDILNDIYEKESILVSDESNIIAGLLVGLNALDISVDLKSDAVILDLPIKTINYSIYLREKLPDTEQLEDVENSTSEQRINEIFDQKNFVEELNKKLELKNEQLTHKLQALETTNVSLSEKISNLKVENIELRNEIDSHKAEILKIQEENKSKINSVYQDLQAERDTFSLSKNGLDQMFIDLQKKFYEEQKIKSNLESELQTITTIKNEQETALKLLENDVKDKHEIVRILREQLEQVKSINLDLVNEAQKNESEYKRQGKSVLDLKEEVSKFTKEIEELKTKLESTEQNLRKKEEVCKLRLEQIDTFQKKTSELESDLTIEKNWRIQLQRELEERNEELRQANSRVQSLEHTEKDLFESRQENESLKKNVHELELTLEEIGSKLGTSHLKMQDFREVTKQLHEFQWESDESVTACKICLKDFNVARRKHHCRRCGSIFCNECSDNKMALPSSSKPVRVCNNCFNIMLQKSTIK